MSGHVAIERIDQAESWEIFSAASQRMLGITGDEFARAWDAGEYAARDELAVMRVAMLRPSGR